MNDITDASKYVFNSFFFYTDDLRLQVVTIATEKTDGYHRFMRSAQLFDLNVEVINLALFRDLHPQLPSFSYCTGQSLVEAKK